MARNEINEIISGAFALMIFIAIGSALVSSVNTLGGLLAILFFVSGAAIAITLVLKLFSLFEDLFS